MISENHSEESQNSNGKNILITPYTKKDYWVTDEISAGIGNVPKVSTSLIFKDIVGACKVRFGIGRMNYKIVPGLYAIGNPNKDSLVIASANYKLTFDILRRELEGLNLWLLILDTKGINVWCAAGKGTFGTNELANRIFKTKLAGIVSHKTLILPELGASGVSAQKIKKQTGFNIVYGPVRANDIKTFIDSKLKATDEMRRVRFTFKDRLVLVPMEFIPAANTSIFIFGILFILNLFLPRKFELNDFLIYGASVIIGTVLTPILLPFIPGKAFSFKGFLLGLIATIAIALNFGWFSGNSILLGIGYTLALPSYSAYLAMNFTGSSTYTSFSGVIKEMKTALPPIIISITAGIILILIRSFIV